MEIVDHIAETPLFNGLPREQLEKLAKIAVEKKYRKGQTLFAEGSKAIGLFVIISGKIKVYKLSLEGKEQILHIFAGGDFFGEVPMFAGGNYPAHAETLEASRVLFFPREAFVDLLKREASLALNMLGNPVPAVAPLHAPDRRPLPQGSARKTGCLFSIPERPQQGL